MLNTIPVLIIIIIIIIVSILHELVKKFLLYNATLSSSALDEHMFIVVKINRLTKHSPVDCR